MNRFDTCAAVEPRLSDYLTGALPAADEAAVRAHLEHCERCRASAQELAVTLDLLRDALAASASAPPRLDPARRERVLAARPPALISWLDTHRGLLASAASITLLLGVLGALLLPASHTASLRFSRAPSSGLGLDRALAPEADMDLSTVNPSPADGTIHRGVAAVRVGGGGGAGGGGAEGHATGWFRDGRAPTPTAAPAAASATPAPAAAEPVAPDLNGVTRTTESLAESGEGGKRAEKMVKLKVAMPKPLFQGTPTPAPKVRNLEKTPYEGQRFNIVTAPAAGSHEWSMTAGGQPAKADSDGAADRFGTYALHDAKQERAKELPATAPATVAANWKESERNSLAKAGEESAPATAVQKGLAAGNFYAGLAAETKPPATPPPVLPLAPAEPAPAPGKDTWDDHSAIVTKSGSGTLTLSGKNTYAGGTTVNAGTLDVGGKVAVAGATRSGANAYYKEGVTLGAGGLAFDEVTAAKSDVSKKLQAAATAKKPARETTVGYGFGAADQLRTLDKSRAPQEEVSGLTARADTLRRKAQAEQSESKASGDRLLAARDSDGDDYAAAAVSAARPVGGRGERDARKRDEVKKAPVLGDVPVLGRLFGATAAAPVSGPGAAPEKPVSATTPADPAAPALPAAGVGGGVTVLAVNGGTTLNYQRQATDREAPVENKSTLEVAAPTGAATVEKEAGQVVQLGTGAAVLDATDRPAPPANPESAQVSTYAPAEFNPYVEAAENAFSTFAIDVDTASYAMTRRFLGDGRRPPPESVRTEEFVNSFDYDYAPPVSGAFAIHAAAAPGPFRRSLELLKIGIQGRRIGRDQKRVSAITLVVDTSGSMNTPDRIGRIREALALMVPALDPADRVALVQFDTEARLVLEPTPAAEQDKILGAVAALTTGGSTHLEAGLRLGYEVAARGFVSGGSNRLILMSDGVANLGAEDSESILKAVEQYRQQGIYCTVLGFGTGAYNDAMLESLADKGDGAYDFVDSLAEAKRLLVDELAATLHTIARDVKIQVEFNPERVKRWRQVGYENRKLTKEQFRDDTVDAGEVGSGQSVTALYELELQGAAAQPLGTVRVRYRDLETGAIVESARRLAADDLQRTFDDAPPRFRLAAAVAEFAELLRLSPYTAGTDIAELEQALRPIAAELHLDRHVQELLRLVQTARQLPPP